MTGLPRSGPSDANNVVPFADFRKSLHQLPVSKEHPSSFEQHGQPLDVNTLHNVHVVEEFIQLTVRSVTEQPELTILTSENAKSAVVTIFVEEDKMYFISIANQIVTSNRYTEGKLADKVEKLIVNYYLLCVTKGKICNIF